MRYIFRAHMAVNSSQRHHLGTFWVLSRSATRLHIATMTAIHSLLTDLRRKFGGGSWLPKLYGYALPHCSRKKAALYTTTTSCPYFQNCFKPELRKKQSKISAPFTSGDMPVSQSYNANEVQLHKVFQIFQLILRSRV